MEKTKVGRGLLADLVPGTFFYWTKNPKGTLWYVVGVVSPWEIQVTQVDFSGFWRAGYSELVDNNVYVYPMIHSL